MENSINKLLSISSKALIDSRVVSDHDVFSSRGRLGNELFELLAMRNGFYAFESALHVFPVGYSQGIMDLKTWNSESLWKNEYGHLARKHLFFAEDVFGNQFCIKDGVIFLFDAETGDIELCGGSIAEWAQMVLGDYEVLTGFPLAHEWQESYGPLPAGMRLVPIIPFVLGGDFAIDNLHLLDAIEGMRLRGDLAQQIYDLPDGTEIKFRITD